DPYGRWLLLGNYLTAMPGHAGDGETARALLDLAVEAGRTGVPASDPRLEPFRSRFRAGLPRDQVELFDTLAPPAGEPQSETPDSLAIAADLTAAALADDPLFDPGPFLPNLRRPTLLAHGRD